MVSIQINMPFLKIWLREPLRPVFSHFFIAHSYYLPGSLEVGMSGVGCGSNDDV